MVQTWRDGGGMASCQGIGELWSSASLLQAPELDIEIEEVPVAPGDLLWQ